MCHCNSGRLKDKDPFCCQPGHGASAGVWRPVAVGRIHPPEVSTAVWRYCAACRVLRQNCGPEQGLGVPAGSHQVSPAY